MEEITNINQEDTTINNNTEPKIENINQQPTNDFTIPQEYKEKSWAKNIKSIDDLYKSYDNAQSLIGKKTIGIPDFDKATDEELKSFYDKLTPQDPKDYNFEDMSDEEKNFFGTLFKENGINKKSAQSMVSSFKNYMNSFYDDTDFKNELRTRFGDEYETKVNETTKFLSQYVSDKDKQLLDKLPNTVLCTMLEFADNVKKAFGVEMKSHIDNKQVDNTGFTKADYDKTVLSMLELDKQGKLTASQRQDFVNKINSMSKNIKW